MSSNIQIPKTCQFCKTTFVAKTTVTKYCSHRCGSRAYKKRQKENKINSSLQELKQDILGSRADLPLSLNNDINSKTFLSIKETAFLLGTSRWTIQRLIKKGTLKSAKLGRKTIIQRNDLNNLFQ